MLFEGHLDKIIENSKGTIKIGRLSNFERLDTIVDMNSCDFDECTKLTFINLSIKGLSDLAKWLSYHFIIFIFFFMADPYWYDSVKYGRHIDQELFLDNCFDNKRKWYNQLIGWFNNHLSQVASLLSTRQMVKFEWHRI